MKAQRSIGRAERAAFQILEPRLLLDGAVWPEIGALGGPDATATAGAAEEIHVSGEGIGADTGLCGPPVKPQERPILEVVLGSTGDYEYTATGDESHLMPQERPIIEEVLGSTEDFEFTGPFDTPVLPQERPIIEIVLGSTGDYEYTSSRPIIEDILGSTEDFEPATAGGPTVEPDERPIIEDILGRRSITQQNHRLNPLPVQFTLHGFQVARSFLVSVLTRFPHPTYRHLRV